MSAHKTHGLTHHREYDTWRNMMKRCYDPKNPKYPRYGGRGIGVCREWHDASVAIPFFEKMNRKRGETLDRIDNDRDYSPENVRMAPAKIQARNKGNTTRLTFQGVTKSVGEWAEELGISHNTLFARLRYGWSVQSILTQPLQTPKPGSHQRFV